MLYAGVAGESLSNRKTTKLGTGLFRCRHLERDDWEPIGDRLGPAPEVRAVVVVPGATSTVLVGTQWGVHLSLDAGDTFARLDLVAPEFGVWSLAISPHDPSIMLAGYEPAAVMRSTDGGHSWHRIELNVDFPACTAGLPKRIMSLTFDPVRPGTVYGAIEVGGLIRSQDGGLSWEPLCPESDVDRVDFHAVAVTPETICVAGRTGIVVRNTRTGQWTQVIGDQLTIVGASCSEVAGIVQECAGRFAGNLKIEALEAVASGGTRLVLGVQVTGRLGYGGAFDPKGVGARRGAEGRAHPAACGHAYLAVLAETFRAVPSARVITGLGVEIDSARFHREQASFLALAGGECDCNRPSTGLAGGAHDQLISWLPLGQYCRSAIASRARPGRVWVGAGAGYQAEHGVLYRSDDAGRSWRSHPLPSGADGTVFAMSEGTDGMLYCATKNGQVFGTMDGESWVGRSLPRGDDPIYCIAAS